MKYTKILHLETPGAIYQRDRIELIAKTDYGCDAD
jgi:hypothetical protein